MRKSINTRTDIVHFCEPICHFDVEKIKEIKLKGLIGTEYPVYFPYLFLLAGVFIVIFLNLYRPERLFLAAAILVISLFIAVSAYRRRREVVNGSIVIELNQEGIVIKSPFCNKSGHVRLENVKKISVDILTINQLISDGIEKYYKVCVNCQVVFRSRSREKAEMVRENIWVFFNEGS